jgi:hypothetical protein
VWNPTNAMTKSIKLLNWIVCKPQIWSCRKAQWNLKICSAARKMTLLAAADVLRWASNKEFVECIPGASEFIPKWVVSVTCSHLLVCLSALAYSSRLLLACLSLCHRDVRGMWCHRKGSSIPRELPAAMEPAKNLFFVLWLLPQVSHPRVSALSDTI